MSNKGRGRSKGRGRAAASRKEKFEQATRPSGLAKIPKDENTTPELTQPPYRKKQGYTAGSRECTVTQKQPLSSQQQQPIDSTGLHPSDPTKTYTKPMTKPTPDKVPTLVGSREHTATKKQPLSSQQQPINSTQQLHSSDPTQKYTKSATTSISHIQDKRTPDKVSTSVSNDQLLVKGLPKRPGYGKKGRPIILHANHFKLDYPRGSCIYHYDVTIIPDKCPSHINRQVIYHIQKEYHSMLGNCKLAFDGKKSLYTSRPLPSPCKLMCKGLKLSNDMKERDFQVEIKLAATISLDVLQSTVSNLQSEEHRSAIQALDIVVRNMSSMQFSTVGRSFFSPSDEQFDLGQGRRAWFGRYQSVRPCEWSVTLNVDVSATTFYKPQPVIDFMNEVLSQQGRGYDGRGRGGRGGYDRGGRGGYNRGGRGDYEKGGRGGYDRGGRGSYDRGGRGGYDRGGRGDYDRGGRGGYDRGGRDGFDEGYDIESRKHLTDSERLVFSNEIKGLKVQVTHLSYPRKYKVKKATVECAKDLKFNFEGKQCTVAKYFEIQHKKQLQYPLLPCLQMEGANKTNYIPIEFCEVVEQKCNRKLTPEQTSALIRGSAKPANKRKSEILSKVRHANFSKDETIKDFGIKISNEMACIEGRVLDPPNLKYAREKTVTPQDGKWDTRKQQFVNVIKVKCWAVVVYPQRFNVNEFMGALVTAGDQSGLIFDDLPNEYIYQMRRGDTAESVFRRMKSLSRNNIQIIIVILDRDTSYSDVKTAGDKMVGVITQCVKYKTASGCNPQSMGNICLKINQKLGGINSTISPSDIREIFPKECVIIFGADVTHPAPGDKTSPSIAAVTASMDEHFMRYVAVAKILQSRQEVMKIDELSQIIREMLIKFRRKTGQNKPTKIVFYRDGVSEGQFKEVILNEVAAIQKACLALEAGYEPGITFLVVQKRHHTRLFPAKAQDECGKSRNIPPGTVVDKDITHPSEFDFFLCSHAGIQGTSKPSHYHILWDDNNFTADNLQSLTFQLCHCYARCTRSVSYPAPTYYSHLVAFRARNHLQSHKDKLSSDGSMSSRTCDEASEMPIGEMIDAIELHENVLDTMYFV